jgi:hypothetical protein
MQINYSLSNEKSYTSQTIYQHIQHHILTSLGQIYQTINSLTIEVAESGTLLQKTDTNDFTTLNNQTVF